MTNDQLVATRQAFGEGLFELMKANEQVVALTADLGESLRMLKIRDEMPERFFDTGVAEANMAGMAAGLALGGYVPFAGTFAVFMTRAFDHIRLQICQNNLHAVMVGSHGGVSNALDGGSAHALEDIAYMRSLPNMTIVYPADADEMRQAVTAVAEADGPVYLRLYREATPLLRSFESFEGEASEFQIGKARVIRKGADVSIVATGPQAAFALQAAETLAGEKISAEVVAVHTIVPLDVETIAASAAKTGKVVTAEDHSVNGGLGSAVAEALGERQPTPLVRVGVRQFGESGKYDELARKLGIDAAGIADAARGLLA
jgi:transketolase